MLAIYVLAENGCRASDAERQALDEHREQPRQKQIDDWDHERSAQAQNAKQFRGSYSDDDGGIGYDNATGL